MGSGKSKMQKNLTTNERGVRDYKMTPEEKENTKNLPELESLTLKLMKNIDDCIINLSNESKNLKLLDINYCSNVSADALKKIPNLINLEELKLRGCDVDSDAFASIVNGCAKLKNLDISTCEKISGDALVKISNLKNLEVLDIRETGNVNDDVIIEVANNCKNIKELFMKCKNVSSLAVDKLDKSERLKALELLLKLCDNVSSLALNELAKLEHLEVLELINFHKAGDEIFKNMYKLKKLKCTWCRNVTDTGIMRIIKNASNLEYLMICETGITSKTLVYAADETKKRTNNIVLKVITNERVLQDYQKLKHDSGHLIDMNGWDMCCKNC